MNAVQSAVLIGLGATATMDGLLFALNRLAAIPLPNYGLVGRWAGHMLAGRFWHDSIGSATAIRGELILGWMVHYLVGIAFAGILLAVWGLEWARNPSLGPALVVGITSVAAPFFLMQPSMGLGVLASRSPNPAVSRMRSLLNHGLFGVGLYIAGKAFSFFQI